jgi:DNA invertase Pin-like site-specific DNA recombinase
MTEHTLPPMRVGGVTSKLHDHHVRRLAIVYVRQSHPHRVIEHVESTARQYALVDRAVALGWARERVVVIDEDQGQSGQSMVTRLGFQRVLAEVSLDHVGLILGLEMSRLARSNKDWHQLLELCALFRTLLADADGLYDPTDYNDRLLLGLRGMMSEAELYILKSRMFEGMRHKAKRGELLNHPPMGYVRGPDGDYQWDPDEQAQRVIRLIFDVFEQQGSLHGLLRYLVTQDIRLPIRPHYGAARGQLDWRRPTRMTLQTVLHHPIYAGAYRWGYRKLDPRKQQPGRRSTGRTVNAPDVCEVLIKDRFPAYISWERFEAIQHRLANNRAIAEALGAPREGSSLLGGLLVCGRCGRRLIPAYSGKANRLRYSCSRGVSDYGAPLCLSLSGAFLDRFVVEQIRHVLQPASLELSIAAEHALRTERAQLEAHWQQRLERSHYEAERAARQYAAVEPENRLVARELERRWEEALRQEQQVQEDYARFHREQPPELTRQEHDAIGRLAQDVPALWEAPETTAQDRQEMVRLLVERVTIEVPGASEHVSVTIQWAGGVCSEHRVIRPVAQYDQLSTYQVLRDRIDSLRRRGLSYAQVAAHLNRDGFAPPKRTERFSGSMIARLLSHRGLHGPRPRAMVDTTVLQSHEYWLTDFARTMNMPIATVHKWQRMGWVHSRKVAVAAGRWAIWADDSELERLRRLRTCKRQWPEPRYPAALTMPTPRDDVRRTTATAGTAVQRT